MERGRDYECWVNSSKGLGLFMVSTGAPSLLTAVEVFLAHDEAVFTLTLLVATADGVCVDTGSSPTLSAWTAHVAWLGSYRPQS